MKVKILSSYPCLIKNEEGQVELDMNQTLEVEGGKLSVYPLEKKVLPFVLDTSVAEDNTFYAFAEYQNNKYIYLLSGNRCENYYIKNFNLGKNTGKVEIGESKVIFEFPPFKKQLNLLSSYEKFECQNVNDIILVRLTETSRQSLIAFNSKSGNLKVFNGQTITIDKNIIKITQIYNNFAGHQKLSNYKIDKDGMKRVDESFIYKDNKARITNSSSIIPSAFVEAINLSDYSLAHSYLSEELKSKLGIEELKTFFDNINYSFPLNPMTFLIKNRKGKYIYTFTVNDNKIIDIDYN